MKKLILLALLFSASIWACGFGTSIGGGQCRGFITSGTTFTVPSDWTSTNTIELVGGGNSGGAGSHSAGKDHGGGGGGGGAYSKISNQSISGTVGLGLLGVDTFFCSDNTGNCAVAGGVDGSSVIAVACGGAVGLAASGSTNGTGGAGGSATGLCASGNGSALGTVKFAGGSGADGAQNVGGGGGGSAGLHGAGGNATNGSVTGGTGDNGTVAANTSGTEWDATHGSAGGANGPTVAGNGSSGLNYGGGASGGLGATGTGGVASSGLIVITYTSSAPATAVKNIIQPNGLLPFPR